MVERGNRPATRERTNRATVEPRQVEYERRTRGSKRFVRNMIAKCARGVCAPQRNERYVSPKNEKRRNERRSRSETKRVNAVYDGCAKRACWQSVRKICFRWHESACGNRLRKPQTGSYKPEFAPCAHGNAKAENIREAYSTREMS